MSYKKNPPQWKTKLLLGSDLLYNILLGKLQLPTSQKLTPYPAEPRARANRGETLLKQHCTARSLHQRSELQGSVPILTHPFNIHTPQDQELGKHKYIFAQDFVPQQWKPKQNTFISHSSWSWHSLCYPSTTKYPHFTGGGTIHLTYK